jgi:hypothetical protein
MLSRGDFGAIMHIDIHPPLYVTDNTITYLLDDRRVLREERCILHDAHFDRLVNV